MALAFVFPGQGSQSVGMLSDLATDHPEVRTTFDSASGVLGYDLWNLAQQGPAERLAETEVTQPLMLVAGVATYRVWCSLRGRTPDIVAGHSLGEFSALVAAGVMSFEAAVGLVRFRGQVMQEAVPAGEGGMAAILGLSDEDVEAACAEAAQGQVVEAVNFNAPAQVVIAGHTAALQRALESAKARGAKRGLALPISVPCHSSLMRAGSERLAGRLLALPLQAPRMRFMSSVDAVEFSEPTAIGPLMVRQLASPVRWVATVRALVAAGVETLVECGPGKVLTGLGRRIEKRPEIACFALEDRASLAAALAAVGTQGD